MGDDLEQLKTVFRSLVVSCPTQMDVRSLLRDYRNMIGAPVPMTKYGYKNPVEFLQERFSDCFLFSGLPSNPVLTLIVPNSLKHIDKFVQKQKVSSSSKFNPKRRSVPETMLKSFRQHLSNDNPQSESNSTNCKHNNKPINNFNINHNPKEKTIKVIKSTKQPNGGLSKYNKDTSKYNERSSVSNKRLVLTSTTETQSNTTHETINSKEVVSNKHQQTTLSEQLTGTQSIYNSTIKDIPSVSSKVSTVDMFTTHHKTNDDAVRNFFKKRLPLYNSSLYLDEEFSSPESVDHQSEKQHTATYNISIKARQLEKLKQEILQLICESPEGVWCTNLISLYRERYNRELCYNRFGYTSIVSFVYCLEERVLITRPEDTGDWLLQDRAQADSAPRSFRARRLPYTTVHSSQQHEPDDALPGIDYDPDVFPEDCMHFMESIEPMSLSDFRPGAMVEVIIGEVYSPSHFWFLRVGEEYNFAMEDMMDEMTQYYEGEGRTRVLSRGAVRVGHYCSSLFEADWHRSLIVKLVDCDTVKVRHVDYGTVDTVPVTALRPLRRLWAKLPAQAVRARLAAVRPAAGGWRWSRASCAAFLALVSNRRLVANVVATDPRDNIAEMLLIDTSGEEDVCISKTLVRAGHADPRPDCSLMKPDAYLYPRFEALETGATPNYAEIHTYLRDGIAIDYVDEYRAHVPHTPPRSPCGPDDSLSQPDLPTRIPLLLPDRPDPPKSAPALTVSVSTPGGERTPPTSHQSLLATAYLPPVTPSPPPPYVPPLSLSAAECDTYRMLAGVNPEAAHWFILGALGHAVSSSAQPSYPPPGVAPIPLPWLAYSPHGPSAPAYLSPMYSPQPIPPAPMPIHPLRSVPPLAMHPPHPLSTPPVHPPYPISSSLPKPPSAALLSSASSTSVSSSHVMSARPSRVNNIHLPQVIRPPPGFGY